MDHATAFAIQTLSGNPIVTAAGRAVIRAIAEERLIERANRIGAIFENGLRALSARHSRLARCAGARWAST
jgi:4-aminobutyrate aminotransferase